MQNLYKYNSMIPLTVGSSGGPKPLPKKCPKNLDCTDNEDIGCCSDIMHMCNIEPGHPYVSCTDIKGCLSDKKYPGSCTKDPSQPPIGEKGCFRNSDGCELVSEKDCDKWYKEADKEEKNDIEHECAASYDGVCYNDGVCSNPWNPHSNPPLNPPLNPPTHTPTHNPCGKIPSVWKSPEGKAFYECLIKNIPKEYQDKYNSIKCMLAYVINNNIPPSEFMKPDYDRSTIFKHCNKPNVQYKPPDFGSSNPTPPDDSFFKTTTGKLVIVGILLLIILGLVGITIMITHKKKK